MWFQPAHHSRWLLQHPSGFGARAQAVPALRVDVVAKRSPEVIQPDQKRVLKCCLVRLGRANPVVLESTQYIRLCFFTCVCACVGIHVYVRVCERVQGKEGTETLLCYELCN